MEKTIAYCDLCGLESLKVYKFETVFSHEIQQGPENYIKRDCSEGDICSACIESFKKIINSFEVPSSLIQQAGQISLKHIEERKNIFQKLKWWNK